MRQNVEHGGGSIMIWACTTDLESGQLDIIERKKEQFTLRWVSAEARS